MYRTQAAKSQIGNDADFLSVGGNGPTHQSATVVFWLFFYFESNYIKQRGKKKVMISIGILRKRGR